MRRSRLLVVDDDRDTLALFQIYFTAAGFDVTPVTTASEALGKIGDGFDAITTDLAMPGIDGFQFIKRVRQLHPRPIPIVAVTGQFLAAVQQGTTSVDCCRVVGKPCDLESVGDLLHWLIRACCHDCPCCQNRQPPPLRRDGLPHEPGRA